MSLDNFHLSHTMPIPCTINWMIQRNIYSFPWHFLHVYSNINQLILLEVLQVVLQNRNWKYNKYSRQFNVVPISEIGNISGILWWDDPTMKTLLILLSENTENTSGILWRDDPTMTTLLILLSVRLRPIPPRSKLPPSSQFSTPEKKQIWIKRCEIHHC